MEDPALNRCLEECRELRTRWTQFYDFIKMAVSGKEITPKAEMKFIELKSRISMLHDGLMERLDHDQKTGMNMMDIMRDHLLLRRVAQYNEAEVQKFNFDWNECFLLLTEHIGTLEEEQQRLGNISEAAYKASRRKEILGAKFHNFFTSLGFKVAVTIAAVLFVVIGVPALNIYDYTELRKYGWSQGVYTIVTNWVYRPFIDPDVPYASVRSIPRNTDYESVEQIKREAFDDVEGQLPKNDSEYFKKTFMTDVLKLQGDPLKQARTKFAQHQSFWAEKFSITNAGAVFFYYIYWENVEPAKTFVEAVQRSAAEGERPSNDVFMMRSGNFVGISYGSHAHREAYFEEYWGFENPQNLLD